MPQANPYLQTVRALSARRQREQDQAREADFLAQVNAVMDRVERETGLTVHRNVRVGSSDARSGGGRSTRKVASDDGLARGRRRMSRRGPHSSGGKSPASADGLALVTLDAGDWRALIAPVASSHPLAHSCIRAIATACQGKSGSVSLWHSAEGLGALLSGVLKVGERRSDAAMSKCNAVAAVVTDQVFRTMGKS